MGSPENPGSHALEYDRGMAQPDEKMVRFEYLVSWESAKGADSGFQVLAKWRKTLNVLGVDGYELVAEHYSETQDGTVAWYRGTLRRPFQE
jgi:hypothetical protein